MHPIILHQRKRDAKAAIPKPLPERPKKLRDLSLPRPRKPQSPGGDISANLPYEIRRMIYISVLGDQIIHLHRPWNQPRIAHYRCEWTTTGTGGYHIHNNDPHKPSQKERKEFGDKINLLLTCRNIYNEASHILYTTNTFSVQTCPNLETFIHFSRSIRPDRLAAITAVYIHMLAECFTPFWTDMSPGAMFWSFIRDWGRVWDILATKMPALRVLKVRLRRTAQELGLGIEEDWIRPMLKVRGLKKFELVLEGDGVYRDWTRGYCEQLKELQVWLGKRLCEEDRGEEEVVRGREASECWKRRRRCEDGICCRKGVV